MKSSVVRNKNAADVKLNVIKLFLGLEEVKGSTLRNEENRLELKLTEKCLTARRSSQSLARLL